MRSARAAALVLASLAAATVVSRLEMALNVTTGETRKFAIVSKAPPSCTTEVRSIGGGRFEYTLSANGAGCSPTWGVSHQPLRTCDRRFPSTLPGRQQQRRHGKGS